MLSKHTLGSDALEESHDLTNAVLGVKTHQEVNVVLVITELFDLQVVPLFNASHCLTQSGDNFSTQKCLTVLHRKDQVVVGVVSTVVSFDDWHSIIIGAYEGNLWFPSCFLPPAETHAAETAGNCWIKK